jgi:hypothetical protein
MPEELNLQSLVVAFWTPAPLGLENMLQNGLGLVLLIVVLR